MLYLVKLDSCYKIGYSDNIEQRLKQFEPTHIEVKLLSTKFGNRSDEKELHKLCKNFKIKNEIFEINEEVINIFNCYISTNLKKELLNLEEKYNDKLDNLKKIISCQEKCISLQNKLVEGKELILTKCLEMIKDNKIEELLKEFETK